RECCRYDRPIHRRRRVKTPTKGEGWGMSGAAKFAYDPVFPAENDPSWRDHAACLGADPDLFFPPPGPYGAEDAKAICQGCPVRAECLDYAVTTAQKYGIWGGTNERERREIRKQRGLNVRTKS